MRELKNNADQKYVMTPFEVFCLFCLLQKIGSNLEIYNFESVLQQTLATLRHENETFHNLVDIVI